MKPANGGLTAAIALRGQGHSPEAIKRATMHGTNEAFERYLQVNGDELRGLYADTRGEVRRIDENRNNTNRVEGNKHKKY